MEQAQAAALLFSNDAPIQQRLAAVATLRARGDLESRSLLDGLSNQPPPVAAAAHAAVAVDRPGAATLEHSAKRLLRHQPGSVLLLAAAGLAITFGVMGVINMAHGEMVMIGAYTTYVVQQVMHQIAPSLYEANLLFAVPLAFHGSGVVGIAIERSLIRWLYGRPLETLLATWGLSLVLQQAVRSLFGAHNLDVDTPGWMSGDMHLGGLTLTLNRLYIILFAVIVLAALMAALRFTPLGLRMRAVTQNRLMAAAMGIRTPWIDALTFGLGSGVAGMAGVALSQIDNVSPNLGQNYIIDSFMVVVFGGVGNLWGTTVGATDAGHRQQVPGAGRRRRAGQDRRAGPADPVHPAPPARHVPAEGTGGRGMMKLDRTAWIDSGGACSAARCLLAALNLGTAPTSARACADLCHRRWPASICASRCWRWRSIWSGVSPASCRWATRRSSRSAATPWACT